jgi:WD40 repeat protein
MFAPGYDQAYHLAIRCTRDDSLRFSAIAMAALAETLKARARHLRRMVILDCCFAAESFKYMQAAPDQVALRQTTSAFEEKSKRSGFPSRGTALLGSSGHKEPSLILRNESGTMFSEALIHALTSGNTRQPDATHLSLYELKTLAEDALENLGEGSAPRPFLSSPDQSDGDVAAIPFFPNGAAKSFTASSFNTKSLQVAEVRQPEAAQPQHIRPLTNFMLTHIFDGYEKKATAVAFSPNGQLLAGGGENKRGHKNTNKTVKLWNLHTKELVRTLEHHQGTNTVAFSPDGRLLASGGGTLHEIDLWDLSTGERLRHLREAYDSLETIAFSPDGQLLASGGTARNIVLWNPHKQYDAPGLSFEERQPKRLFVSINKLSAKSISFSPDGQLLACSFFDGRIRLWNPRTKEELHGFTGHPGGADAIAFSPDGQILASGGGRDHMVKLWNPHTGELLYALKGHTDGVRSLAFSPDGQLLASGSFDKTIKLWNPSAGEYLHTIKEPENWVLSVAFSPDGHLLACGCEGGSIYLWDRAM